MARTAMTEAFNKIGAPIPVFGLVWVRHEPAGNEVHEIPELQAEADVKWKRQLIWNDLVVHRLDRCKIGTDRQHIVARNLRVGGIGHGWIEVIAAAPDSIMHGRDKLIVSPRAYARIAIGRDVRR